MKSCNRNKLTSGFYIFQDKDYAAGSNLTLVDFVFPKPKGHAVD